MKKVLVLLIAAFSIPSHVQAEKMQFMKHAAVMQDVQVFSDKSGKNRGYTAVRIQVRVMLGGNACMADGFKASLVVDQASSGKRFVTATVSGMQPENKVCPLNYDPVFEVVGLTLRDPINAEVPTTLMNAYEIGGHIKLSAFQACDEGAICTKEWNPQSCTYRDLNFEGSNPCVVEAHVRTYACVKGLDFDPREPSCVSIYSTP